MSPEINGNPPSVTKRKKREKKPPQMSTNPFDFNAPNTTYFPNNYQNSSIPDLSNYYSFLNCSNPEPVSLPVFPVSYMVPNIGMHNISTPKQGTLPANFFSGCEDTEYLSLPVVNMDQGDEDSKRRYSDPGLPNDSDSSSNSIENRVVQKLTQQVNLLKENNRKLNREVTELKIELNLLKQQQNMRQFDREYEPGMLAEVIREVRDAARVREDALLARVKHMIEEKQLSMSHLHMLAEKNKNNDRIAKLEEQLKNLSVNQSSRTEEPSGTIPEEPNSSRQVLELEREALELRRELQDTRARKEEADQKLLQLDKKLSNMLRRSDASTSDVSEDGKGVSDSLSIITSSSIPAVPIRVTLSGPVTDL